MDPAVDVPLPYVPKMTGNLATDVGALLGARSELFSAGRNDRELEQLRDILLSIIGGLGTEGVRAWLDSGSPNGWRLAITGDLEVLAERAAHLIDSPMT